MYHAKLGSIGKRHSSGQYGRSIVQSIAYGMREKLTQKSFDSSTNSYIEGETHDYLYLGGCCFKETLAPTHSPTWVYNRETLWNEVERVEKRVNAEFAKYLQLALPNELNIQQCKKMVREFLNENIISMDLIADYSFHDDKPDNFHAHVYFTTRRIESHGFAKNKIDIVDIIDKKPFLYQLRENYAKVQNKYLAMYGFKKRVTHLSHKKMGLDLIATKHIGYASNNKRSKAELNDRIEYNNQVYRENLKIIINNPEIIIKKLCYEFEYFDYKDISNAVNNQLQLNVKAGNIVEQDFDYNEIYNQIVERIVGSSTLSKIKIKTDSDKKIIFSSIKYFEQNLDLIRENVNDETIEIEEIFGKDNSDSNREIKDNIMADYPFDVNDLYKEIFRNPDKIRALSKFNFSNSRGKSRISNSSEGLISNGRRGGDKNKVTLFLNGVINDFKGGGFSRNVISYYAEETGLKWNEALFDLAREYGIYDKDKQTINHEIIEVTRKYANERLLEEERIEIEKEKQNEKIKDISATIYKKIYKQNLGKELIEYLSNRGWNESEILEHTRNGNILYVESYDEISKALNKASSHKNSNYNFDDLKNIKPLNFFFKDTHKFFIPCYNDKHEIIGFITRDITSKETKNKYVNTRGLQVSEVLYNAQSLEEGKDILVVEGVLDALRLTSSEGKKALNHTIPLGLLGNSLSTERINLISKYNPRTIYIGLDNDESGVRSTQRMVKSLLEHGLSNFRIVKLRNDIKDFDELISKEGYNSLRSILNESLSPSKYLFEEIKNLYLTEIKDQYKLPSDENTANEFKTYLSNVLISLRSNKEEKTSLTQLLIQNVSKDEHLTLNSIINTSEEIINVRNDNLDKDSEVLHEENIINIESEVERLRDLFKYELEENDFIAASKFKSIINKNLSNINEEFKRSLYKMIINQCVNLGKDLNGETWFIKRDNLVNLSNEAILNSITEHGGNFEKGKFSDFLNNIRNENKEIEQNNDKINNKDYKLIKDLADVIIGTLTDKYSIFTEKDIKVLINNELNKKLINEKFEQHILNKVLEGTNIITLKRQSLRGETYYTTKEYLELEKNTLGFANSLNARISPLNSKYLENFIENVRLSNSLNEEQIEAIKYLTTDTTDLAIIDGFAGAGKTRLLQKYKEIIEKKNTLAASFGLGGNKIIGVSVMGIAALNLERDTGIKSITIEAMKNMLKYSSAGMGLKKGDILIVDEAATVTVEDYYLILERAKIEGFKVVLTGDLYQAQPIQSAQIFDHLVDKVGSFSLRNVLRQRDKKDAEATKMFASGNFYGGLSYYKSKGNFVHMLDESTTLRQLAHNYVKDLFNGASYDDSVVITATNADVEVINNHIRKALEDTNYFNFKQKGRNQSGVVNSKEFKLEPFKNSPKKLVIRRGEKIVLTENDYKDYDIRNGMTAEVLGFVGESGIKIRLCDFNRVLIIDTDKYKGINYGYCLTSNKTQGISVENTHVYASRDFYSNNLYPALTRHKNNMTIYYNDDDFSDIRDISDNVGRDKVSFNAISFMISSEELLKADETYKNVFLIKRVNESIKEVSEKLQIEKETDEINEDKQKNIYKFITELKSLIDARSKLAEVILNDYDSHRRYLQEAGLSNLQRMKECAGVSLKYSDIELNEIKLIKDFLTTKDELEKILLADSISRKRVNSVVFYAKEFRNEGLSINELKKYADKIDNPKFLQTKEGIFTFFESEDKKFGTNSFNDVKTRLDFIAFSETVIKEYNDLQDFKQELDKLNENHSIAFNRLNDCKITKEQLELFIKYHSNNEELANSKQKLIHTNKEILNLEDKLSKFLLKIEGLKDKISYLEKGLGRFKNQFDYSQLKEFYNKTTRLQAIYELGERIYGSDEFKKLLVDINANVSNFINITGTKISKTTKNTFYNRYKNAEKALNPFVNKLEILIKKDQEDISKYVKEFDNDLSKANKESIKEALITLIENRERLIISESKEYNDKLNYIESSNLKVLLDKNLKTILEHEDLKKASNINYKSIFDLLKLNEDGTKKLYNTHNLSNEEKIVQIETIDTEFKALVAIKLENNKEKEALLDAYETKNFKDILSIIDHIQLKQNKKLPFISDENPLNEVKENLKRLTFEVAALKGHILKDNNEIFDNFYYAGKLIEKDNTLENRILALNTATKAFIYSHHDNEPLSLDKVFTRHKESSFEFMNQEAVIRYIKNDKELYLKEGNIVDINDVENILTIASRHLRTFTPDKVSSFGKLREEKVVEAVNEYDYLKGNVTNYIHELTLSHDFTCLQKEAIEEICLRIVSITGNTINIHKFEKALISAVTDINSSYDKYKTSFKNENKDNPELLAKQFAIKDHFHLVGVLIKEGEFTKEHLDWMHKNNLALYKNMINHLAINNHLALHNDLDNQYNHHEITRLN
ncbi:MAG: MobA/MobL family protein [Sphingobacteriia bacterium]|nr:MobA/MobL family protein [Sphingobacteriia bacterium]